MRVSSLQEGVLELAILRGHVDHGHEALSHHSLVGREELYDLTEQGHEFLTKGLILITRSGSDLSLGIHADERLLLHLFFGDRPVLAHNAAGE